jgi:thioredoxin 1
MSKFSQIINDTTPVLVDFYADWCQPCKVMAPELKQLKNEMGDAVKIIKIDVDRNPQLSAAYNIRSVPTLMLFKEGMMKWSGAGVVRANELKQIVKTNL